MVVRTIRLDLAYEGTAYHGFGFQPGLCTVQGVVERELGRLLGHEVRVMVAGRTDAGVHARGQVLSFRTTSAIPAAAVAVALRSRLPADLLALQSCEAPAGFDARRSALSRHYRYSIWRDRSPDLFWRRFSWHLPERLDEDRMCDAAEQLVGRHDFGSFIGQASQQPERVISVRTVQRAEWSREGDLLHFDCRADGFGRHMVRNMVGTLVQCGRRGSQADQMAAILAAADRRAAGPTAPARGLTLMSVAYAPASGESDDQESRT